MPTRRKALRAVAQAAAGLALLPFATRRAESSVLVNDIHSQLNPTRVARIVAIDSETTLRAALATARAEGKPVCIAGGRHAMGGQQFAEDAVLLDMRPMRRIVGLDSEQGVVEAEAGIQWPELIERLIVSFPKILSGADSRDEAESAHHPVRCLPPSICLGRLSPTCSSRNAGLKSRISFSAISSILL